MDVVALLITEAQTTLFEEPSEHALDDTAMFAQSTSMFRVAFGNQRLDAPLAKRLTDLRLGIVSLVAKDFLRTATASTTRLFDRGNRINQRNGLLRIVDIRACVDQGQRRALAVGGHMSLRAVFPAVGG